MKERKNERKKEGTIKVQRKKERMFRFKRKRNEQKKERKLNIGF